MHRRAWWKDRVRENGLISQMKRRAPRLAHVCVCVFQEEGGICGSCLDSPWVYEQRELGRSHKSSRRGAGLTLITIIRYFPISLSLPHSLSLSVSFSSSCFGTMSTAALVWSMKGACYVFFFFWCTRVWCTKEQKKKKLQKFGNRLRLSNLDFGSLGRPQGVHYMSIPCYSFQILFCFVSF